MRRYRLTRAAQADLTAIAEHIGRESPARARAFVRRLRLACTQLPHFPRSFPLRPDIATGIRSLVIGNYLILYTAEADDSITVERVVHGARDLSRLFPHAPD